MSRKKSKKPAGDVIAVNRRARHDYFIEESLEAGLVLEGWEVKSLRAGNAQLQEGYVTVRNGEAWLIGAHFSPLKTVSTHVKPDPTRSRKLLLHRQELDRLVGAVERKGYALAYGLGETPDAGALGHLGDPFSPYRSVAAWYLWRAADTRL